MRVAVNTAMIAQSRRWATVRPGQARSSADSSPLVKTGTSFSLTAGVRSRAMASGQFLLVGPPPEQLLHRPVLIAGAGVAVAAQQPDHPALDVLRADLVPVRAPGLAEKMTGPEPLSPPVIHPHLLRRLC